MELHLLDHMSLTSLSLEKRCNIRKLFNTQQLFEECCNVIYIFTEPTRNGWEYPTSSDVLGLSVWWILSRLWLAPQLCWPVTTKVVSPTVEINAEEGACCLSGSGLCTTQNFHLKFRHGLVMLLVEQTETTL